MTLRTSLVSLAWDAVAGSSGYDILLDGVKVANAGSRAKTTRITIPEGSEHRVTIKAQPSGQVQEAKFDWSSISAAPPPPPPSPPPTGGTVIPSSGVISSGGVWYGDPFVGSVKIATAAPVTLTGTLKNLTGGTLVQADAAGCQVTLDHVFAYGDGSYATSNRLLRAVNYKAITVRNCTIENTRGMQIQLEQAGSSVLITRNKHHNIIGGNYNAGQSPGNFVQFQDVQKSVIEVSWNEIINERGKSAPTDIISIYQTANVQLLDNYFQHQSDPDGQNWNMNGITVDPGSNPSLCHDNAILRNQLVDGAGIGVFGGSNNAVHDNRVISDGYWGTIPMYQWYFEPIYIAGSNNHAHGNVLAYIGGQGYQYGRYPGTPEGDLAERAKNVYLPPPVDEAAEWALWQQKISGVAIGA